MPQYSFTCSDNKSSLIKGIDDIALKTDRSRSEVIVHLLEYALKEKNRKRKSNAKPGTTEEAGNKA